MKNEKTNEERMPELREMQSDICRQVIADRIRELQEEAGNLQERKAFMPKGKIRIAKRGNSLQYYLRRDPGDPNGKYLRKSEENIAEGILQRDYEEAVIEEIEKEICTLQSAFRNYQPDRLRDIFDGLHKNRKENVHPILLSDEEYVTRWRSLSYEGKNFNPEDDSEFYTTNGERVRSKSEVIIANALERMGVPYRYEYPVWIPGMGRVYADFTCLNVRQRKEMIWEHFGMMTKEKYAEKTVDKQISYMMNGLTLGQNFISTFETTGRPLNTRYVEQVIRRYLL